MTPEKLKEIRELADKATAGPWHQCCPEGNGCGGTMVWLDAGCERMVDTAARGDGEYVKNDPQDRATACFIAAARSDVPALCDALEAAWAEIERLKQDAPCCSRCGRDAI